MRPGLLFLLALASASFCGTAAADPYKDESGNGRGKYERRGDKGREYKEEYRDGDCKVERKWERSGEYKEERKCGPSHSDDRHDVYRESPGAGGPAVVIQPPSVIIEAPPVIIR